MKKLIKHISYRVNKTIRPLNDNRQDSLYKKVSPNLKEKTLLIIKVDSIGDYVIFRNFLKEIKSSEKFKDFKITLLGNVWFKDLAEAYDKDTIDEFIWADIHELKIKKNFNALVKQIYKSGFEYALCPNYSMADEDVKILARSGAKFKICPKGDKLNINPRTKEKYFKKFTKVIDTGVRFDFEYYRYKDLFEQFLNNKIQTNNISIPHPKRITNHIVICAGSNSPLRCWPAKKYAGLIDKLNTESKFILVGGKNDIEMAEKIKNLSSAKTRIKNLCGKINLVELCDYISEAKLMITNDTGPYHIAMALNIQTICVSNGNNFHRFTPYPPEFKKHGITVISDKLENLFQNKEESVKYQKKVSEENMDEIEIEKVFNSIVRLLQND